jgi:hypothetical protein
VDDPDPRDAPPMFVKGSYVEWVGDDDLGRQFHLTHGQPGVVAIPEPMAVAVRWVDRTGWFDHIGIFMQEWLSPLTTAEFDRRAAQLRGSDWPGFPPGEY